LWRKKQGKHGDLLLVEAKLAAQPYFFLEEIQNAGKCLPNQQRTSHAPIRVLIVIFFCFRLVRVGHYNSTGIKALAKKSEKTQTNPTMRSQRWNLMGKLR
jgi:hypothetical protein